MHTLHIQFQTNELTPPPFSHALEFLLKESTKGVQVKFERTYLERDTLSLDEIEEEGFTENDNLTLNCILDVIWWKALENALEESTFQDKSSIKEEEDFLLINNKYPKNVEHWLLLTEQLQQAILEKCEKEEALKIEVCRVDTSQKTFFEFNARFSQRLFFLVSGKKQHSYPWNKLQDFLKDFFTADIRAEKFSEKPGNKTGIYINLGDGNWLELGKTYLTAPSTILKWLKPLA